MKAKKLSPKFIKNLKKIRVLILDVDGVLTDGRLFWIKGQGWNRFFHVHDGYGIRLLMKAGIQVAIFSGNSESDIQERMRALGVLHVYLGNENKLESLKKLIEVTGLSPDTMAYMGDDLFDIPVFEKVALGITVPQAPAKVQKSADYKTTVLGGYGAVREVIDLILQIQGKV